MLWAMGMCNLTTVHANFLQVIMAEAPDALDPISALREQTRTAQRAQAVTNARANPDNQRKTEVDYELFKNKFWPKISPLAADLARTCEEFMEDFRSLRQNDTRHRNAV